jgi:cell division protease FtsH
LTFGERDDLVFLGKDLAMHKNFSEKTAELIDIEVKKIINRNFERSKNLLEKNKPALKAIAEALLDKEVLSSDEIEEIVKGKKPRIKKKAAKKIKPKEAKPKKVAPPTQVSAKRDPVKV